MRTVRQRQKPCLEISKAPWKVQPYRKENPETSLGLSGFGPLAVSNGLVYVTGFVSEDAVVALDMETGGVVWRHNEEQVNSVWAFGRLVLSSSGYGLTALDALTGDQRWEHGGVSALDTAPTLWRTDA